MLPNFLGIGWYRCGTTWLHALLDSHPQVYVPQSRKELYFFRDENWHRGFDWYEQFFPDEEAAQAYQAVGEITPGYLFAKHCIERVQQCPSIERILVMVRDPVARAYSQYRWRVGRAYSDTPSFETVIEQEPGLIQTGCYADALAPWIEAFGRDRVHVQVLEQARHDPGVAQQQLADFLGIDADLFPTGAGEDRVNASGMPKHRQAFQRAKKLHKWLIRHELEWMIKPLKRPARSLLGVDAGESTPLMAEATRRDLEAYFYEPNRRLEQLLDIDVSRWWESGRAVDKPSAHG
jgi:hypothetical protein